MIEPRGSLLDPQPDMAAHCTSEVRTEQRAPAIWSQSFAAASLLVALIIAVWFAARRR